MKIKMVKVFCLGVSLFTVASCTNNGGNQGPEFSYTKDHNLQSDMQQFAYQMQLLHWAMTDYPDDAMTQQQEVISILKRLKQIAADVDSEQNRASHPFLAGYLSDFMVRLDYATTAAESKPPSYYLAGQISGGCASCHWIRDKAKR